MSRCLKNTDTYNVSGHVGGHCPGIHVPHGQRQVAVVKWLDEVLAPLMRPLSDSVSPSNHRKAALDTMELDATALKVNDKGSKLHCRHESFFIKSQWQLGHPPEALSRKAQPLKGNIAC